MEPTYLDWAATAPPDPEIQEQMLRISRQFYANPSAPHNEGRRAGMLLAECRQRLAAVLGCRAREVIFTSGGTESNNMVLFSALHRKRDRKIVLSGIEHASLYQPAGALRRLGFEVKLVPAGRNGRVDPQRLLASVDERTALVAVMLVNNETGAVQPLAEMAAGIEELRRRSGRNIPLHSDAVQALGKIPFQPADLGLDSASFSAHKIGGPRGVGGLYLKEGSCQQFLYSGGEQEGNRRPGTENLPGIFGFVLAAEKAAAHLESNLEAGRRAMQSFIAQLEEIPGAVLNPEGRGQAEAQEFSPYIINVSFPPLPGELVVRVLDEEGFCVSTGSACSSRKKDRFRILEGMGVSRETAFSAVRISIGPAVHDEHLAALAGTLKRLIPELRKVS